MLGYFIHACRDEDHVRYPTGIFEVGRRFSVGGQGCRKNVREFLEQGEMLV